MSDRKQPSLTEDTNVRTTLRTLIVIAAATATFVAAWTWTQADVRAQGLTLQQHNQRINAVEIKVSIDHDILLEIRGDVKALMADRKGTK